MNSSIFGALIRLDGDNTSKIQRIYGCEFETVKKSDVHALFTKLPQWYSKMIQKGEME